MKKEEPKKPVTKERILKTIGLAYRASLLTSGFDAIELALHAGAVALLLIATDGSVKQREKLRRIANEEETEVRDLASSEELGRAIGKDSRIAIAVLDEGMAKKLKQLIDTWKFETSADSAD
ncbi:MAG: ribosomal L7Ae/L30e/S12e/Gadd45 family protein [Clostridiales bacterium]|nr:ribosomal L7Ae/L30e/S12e/Gadd45 family protein [Clostridiales bacterium]